MANHKETAIINCLFSDSDSEPLLGVFIFNKFFRAILDTGSPISIIGDEIINIIKLKNLPCAQTFQPIQFLVGNITADKSIILEVDFTQGKVSQEFILVPNNTKPVLLGRDFLRSANIGILTQLGGYIIGKEFGNIYPFVHEKRKPRFLLEPYKPVELLLQRTHVRLV